MDFGITVKFLPLSNSERSSDESCLSDKFTARRFESKLRVSFYGTSVVFRMFCFVASFCTFCDLLKRHNEFYEQLDGGNPVNRVFANFYMEVFEKTALNSAL